VLGLIESKRQVSNQAFNAAAGAAGVSPMQDAMNRQEFIEGEIVG